MTIPQFISLVEKSLVSSKNLKKTTVKDAIGKLCCLLPKETDSNAVHDILVAIQSIARGNDECLLEKFCTCGLYDLIGKIFSRLQSWRSAAEIQECIADQLLETLVALSECSLEVKLKILEDFSFSSIKLLNQCIGKCRHAFEVLRDINILMEGCPLAVKEKMMRDKPFLENVKALAGTLESSGDYEFQVGLLEFLFRVIPRKQREERLMDFITNRMVCQEIAKIRDGEFETDCRQFLNNFNRHYTESPRVISLPCAAAFLGDKELLKPNNPGYDSFWVDFNIGSERITLFCQQSFDSQESIDDEWETLSLWKTDVKMYEILLTDELQVINITLIKPVAELYPSQQNVNGNVLQIQFFKGMNIEEALELTFEKERIQQKRKPRKVSAPKSPIYMRNQPPKEFENKMEMPSVVRETEDVADIIPGSQTQSETSGNSHRKVSVPKIPMSSFLGKSSTKISEPTKYGSTPRSDRYSEDSSVQSSMHPKKVSEPAMNYIQRRDVIQESVASYGEDDDNVQARTNDEQESNAKALSQNSQADVDSVPDSNPVTENQTELGLESLPYQKSSAVQSLCSSQGSLEETNSSGSKKRGRLKKNQTKMKPGRKKNVREKKPKAITKKESKKKQASQIADIESINLNAALCIPPDGLGKEEKEIMTEDKSKSSTAGTVKYTKFGGKENSVLCNTQKLDKLEPSSNEKASKKAKVGKKKKGGASDEIKSMPSISEKEPSKDKIVEQMEKECDPVPLEDQIVQKKKGHQSEENKSKPSSNNKKESKEEVVVQRDKECDAVLSCSEIVPSEDKVERKRKGHQSDENKSMPSCGDKKGSKDKVVRKKKDSDPMSSSDKTVLSEEEVEQMKKVKKVDENKNRPSSSGKKELKDSGIKERGKGCYVDEEKNIPSSTEATPSLEKEVQNKKEHQSDENKNMPSSRKTASSKDKVTLQKKQEDFSEEDGKTLAKAERKSEKLTSNKETPRQTRSKRNKMDEELMCIINNFSASDEQEDIDKCSDYISSDAHLKKEELDVDKNSPEQSLENPDEFCKQDTSTKGKSQGKKQRKTKRGLAERNPEVQLGDVVNSSKSNKAMFGKSVNVPYKRETSDKTLVHDRLDDNENKTLSDWDNSQNSAETAPHEKMEIDDIHQRRGAIISENMEKMASENQESLTIDDDHLDDDVVVVQKSPTESDTEESISSVTQKLKPSTRAKAVKKLTSKKVRENENKKDSRKKEVEKRKKEQNHTKDNLLSDNNEEDETGLKGKNADFERDEIDENQNYETNNHVEATDSVEEGHCSDSFDENNSQNSIQSDYHAEEESVCNVMKEKKERGVRKPQQKKMVSKDIQKHVQKSALEGNKQSESPVEKKFGKIFKTKQWSKQNRMKNFGFGSQDYIDSSGDSCASVKDDIEKSKFSQSMRKSVLFYMSYSASKQQELDFPTPKGAAGLDPYDFDAECRKKAEKKKRDYSQKFYSKSYCMKSKEAEVSKPKKRGPTNTKAQSKKKFHAKSPSLTFEVQKPAKSKLNQIKGARKTEITCSKENTPDSVRRKMKELNVIDMDERLVTDEDVDLVSKSKLDSRKRRKSVMNINFREKPIESEDDNNEVNQQNDWGNHDSPIRGFDGAKGLGIEANDVDPVISESSSPSLKETRKEKCEEETMSVNEKLLSNFSKICKSIVSMGDTREKRSKQSPVQHSEVEKSPYPNSDTDRYSSLNCSRSEVSWIAKPKNNKPKGKTYKRKKNLERPNIFLENDTPMIKLHTDDTADENYDDDEEEEEENIIQKVDFAPKKPSRGKPSREFKDKIRRSLAPDTPMTDVPDVENSRQQTPLSTQVITPSLRSKDNDDVDDISSIKSFGSILKTPQNNIEILDEENEDEEFTIPSNLKFQDIKGLVSGPSTRTRASKSSLKRKYQSMDTESESSQDQSVDTEEDDLELSRPRPRKLFKANHTVEEEHEEMLEVLSTETDGSNADTLTQRTFNMDIQCGDPGINNLMKSFSTDINAQMQTKKKYLETVTKGLLKTTQKQISQAWLDQQDYRSQIVDRFQDDLLKEVKDLERDIETLQEAEQKALVCFKQQLRVIEKSRHSQEHRVQNLLKLKDNFAKQLSKADKFSIQKQVSVKELMREKMGSLQKKLLLENQKQELASLKKNLQCVFMS